MKSFIVHFDPNGSDDEFNDIVFHYGDSLILEVGEPSREGFVFDGWYDLRIPERPVRYAYGSDLSEVFGYFTLTLVAQYHAE